MEPKLGQIVYSKMGRDKGKYFVIVQIIDDEYVYIADGNVRRMDRPKKKKIKHLVLTSEIIHPIAEKIKAGRKVNNVEIRNSVADLCEKFAANKKVL